MDKLEYFRIRIGKDKITLIKILATFWWFDILFCIHKSYENEGDDIIVSEYSTGLKVPIGKKINQQNAYIETCLVLNEKGLCEVHNAIEKWPIINRKMVDINEPKRSMVNI